MNREKPFVVVLTGAESTGKSRLTMELANHYQAPFFQEYAREYLTMRGPRYTRADVEAIARRQREQMDQALTLDARYVFFDTWLIITKVWLEVVFGEAPAWIDEAIRSSPVGLFLVCDTDIPWEPDPLRENGDEKREQLSGLYKSGVLHYGFPFGLVRGQGRERLGNAIHLIETTIHGQE